MRSLFIITIIGCAEFIQSSSKTVEREGYVIANAKSFRRAYKIMHQARSWEQARLACIDEGGKLAVPKTEKEFKFIQQLVRKIKYANVKGSKMPRVTWLGINNIDNYTVWVNVDGENIKDAEFHTWVKNNGQTYSNSTSEPRCAGLDPMHYGFRDFWCHRAQPSICEKKRQYKKLQSMMF